MITVLAGSNWFALKDELDKLVQDFRDKHGDLAIERIYAPDTNIAEILTSLGGVSLFAADKMVILTEVSGNKDAADKLDKILESVGEGTSLIIVEKVLDKRSVYYKSLKKLNNFQEFNELSENALVQWAIEYVSKSGGKINAMDALYLIERVGSSQTMIERELAKLVLYDKNISRENIDNLTEAAPSSSVFNLVESAFSGNVKGALKIYEEQRTLRKEPQAIYGMLVWQMHMVAVCAAAGNKSAQEVSAETGLNSYSLGKAQIVARRMGAVKVQEFLKLLRDIEITSKSQTYDFDEALKYAITSLAY